MGTSLGPWFYFHFELVVFLYKAYSISAMSIKMNVIFDNRQKVVKCSVRCASPFSKVWWQDATLFVYFSYFYNIHTFIHSITFIQYIYPSPFAETSLHFLIACLLSGETPPCGAEPSRGARRLAVRQASPFLISFVYRD